MKLLIITTVILLCCIGSINSVYGTFLPLLDSNIITQDTIQGFCFINNQTTNIVRCGVGNATLTITHGNGITIHMFPANATMWINGTGSPGATGPQGPQGPQGPMGQVHAVTAGTGISVNGTTGTVQVTSIVVDTNTAQIKNADGAGKGLFGSRTNATQNTIKSLTAGSGISLSSNSTDVTITNTVSTRGTYNQTLANNVLINSGGIKLNFINGTGNPIKLSNSSSGKMVNVTISTINDNTNTTNVIDIYDTTIGDYTTPGGVSVASSSVNSTQHILNFQANQAAGFNGNVHAMKFTALTVGEKINEVCLKINVPAGSVRAKIWQDDGGGGNPGTLLAESGSITVIATAGTVECFTLSSSATVPASGNVWGGFESNSGTLSLYLTTGGCVACHLFVAHVYGSGPNPFGAASSNNNSLYMEIRNDIAQFVNDGNTSTEWISNSETHPNIYIDTRSLQVLSAFAIYPDKTTTTCTQIKLSTSPDTINWNDKRTINVSDLADGSWNFVRWNLDTSTQQYVRTYCNDGSAKVLALWEAKALIPSQTQLIMRHGHEFINSTNSGLALSK